jgi:PAS domain S-box-containing protein
MCGDRSRLPLIISICFAAVAAIGAFGTLAWLTSQLTLAQINPLFVPIAPLTILLLVLLGASWFLYGVRPESSWFRIQAGAVGVLVVILTSLTILHTVMPGSFSLEALIFPNPATIQGYPIARISPVTSVMFLLGGLSLILPVSSSGTRTRTSVALFGIVILSCGVVTSIGYLYQAPLLYGSPTIPVSILAGIAFLFLGTEIWAAAGRECWPTRTLVGDSVQARLLRAFLPASALTLVTSLVLDEVLGNIYAAPLVASLELLGWLVVVIMVIGRLSSGIGAEIDQGIAERTRMDKALQESEEKYRAMIENSPNLIGVFQDGVLKYINSAAILKLGWTYEELVSPSFDPIQNVVAPKSRSLLKENVGKKLRDEDVAPYEITLTKKDGLEVPVLVRGSKIIYNQKPAVEFVFDDITERKSADEKLRESEERYHSLFDLMLDGVYLSTHDGRFVDVNPAFVKMFGYSTKQEVLSIMDIKKELYFAPEERGSHILDTHQEEVEVYRMRRKDGSEIWVEDHGRYVHDARGNISYHEGILRDVTERKHLEEELRQQSLHLEELVAERTRKLRESEEKYRELFEACPVSLWEEDFSAVKQLLDQLRQQGVSNFGAYFANHPDDIAKCSALVKVINVNKATLNLYDAKSVDEIIGGLGGVLTEESNCKQFSGEIVALAQGKKHYEAEMENRTLRGETKHCNVICAVIPGYEQSLAKVLVCIVDLTPQKRLEAEVVKSQRLAAIGETAGMVGHDLRNPLQGIAGAAYNIRRHFLNTIDPSTNEMLEVIDKGVQYANGIVNDLLEFSREMQLQLLCATPKSIVTQTLKDVKVPHNIMIEDTTADTPQILVDVPKLERVLANLIQNAIDAMPEGGKLSISSINTQKEVSISIRDTGVGISQDMVEKIWTPLHTTKARGIGLGLPICRRITEAHGGSISFESTVGKGTTFTLKLPIQHVQTGGEQL